MTKAAFSFRMEEGSQFECERVGARQEERPQVGFIYKSEKGRNWLNCF